MWVRTPTLYRKRCKGLMKVSRRSLKRMSQGLFVPPSSCTKGSGQVDGMGRVSLFTATPQATAKASISRYGTSPVSSSQSNTPKLKDKLSQVTSGSCILFCAEPHKIHKNNIEPHIKIMNNVPLSRSKASEAHLHTSLLLENRDSLMTSGAIQAYVPAALIFVVRCHSRASPKSVIFRVFPVRSSLSIGSRIRTEE